MTYTVTKLITNSFYLSRIKSRKLEAVGGADLYVALDLLNDILSEKSVEFRLIPYFKEFPITAVIGQEKYNIPTLVYAETMTFNIGDLRYSIVPQQRKKYFGSPRADNITSLPFSWHFERVKGGSDIYIYFLPVDAYNMKIWGKASLDELDASNLLDDLTLTYDQFYIQYLKYLLADAICDEYSIAFDPKAAKKLASLEKQLRDLSKLDLTMVKQSTLQRQTAINYGDVNLGGGWRP